LTVVAAGSGVPTLQTSAISPPSHGGNFDRSTLDHSGNGSLAVSTSSWLSDSLVAVSGALVVELALTSSHGIWGCANRFTGHGSRGCNEIASR
jgi:hypothetical protein